MSQSFQTQVGINPAPGEEGDFFGTNPRVVPVAGPGQFVSPAVANPSIPSQTGLLVGNFAWVNTDTGAVSQSYVPGYQIAFLHRENNAIIVSFLGQASLLVPQGLPVELFVQGDFWARFAAGATPGQRVYADPDTGAPVAGGASAPATASFTASAGASFTLAVTSNVATISAVTGYVVPGDAVTSATLGTATLGAQLSGTPGGAGTYTLVHADFTAEAATSISTVLDVTAIASGVIGAGDVITGSGITANTRITGQISGTPGGVGLYTITIAQRFASTATGSVPGIATPWFVNSLAAAGEVAIISTWG